MQGEMGKKSGEGPNFLVEEFSMGIMGTWKSHITLKLDVGFVILCFVDGHLETRETVSLIGLHIK